MVVALSRRESALRYPWLDHLIAPENDVFSSAASLWEISIKTRLGKLDPRIALERIGDFLETAGIHILDINRHHAVAFVEPEPATRDPFDRMLLAQCQIESLRLVTNDGALVDHPLAWRPNVS